MNFFSEYDKRAEYAEQIKRVVPIGIYGSFEDKHIIYLETLRDFLVYNKYFAMICNDIDCPCPDTMQSNDYTMRKSKVLLRVCQIHIFFFFKEDGEERNTNQSASIELALLDDRKEKHVMMFYEDGSLEQFHKPFKGILERRLYNWPYNSFIRKANEHNQVIVNQLILLRSMSFCYDRILHDLSLGYNSEDDYKNKLRECCREEIRSP